MFALVKPAEESAFDHQADHGHTYGGDDQGQPKPKAAADERGRAKGQERSDHVQGTMENVGNAQDAQYQAQTGRDDEKDRGPAEADQNLLGQG